MRAVCAPRLSCSTRSGAGAYRRRGDSPCRSRPHAWYRPGSGTVCGRPVGARRQGRRRNDDPASRVNRTIGSDAAWNGRLVPARQRTCLQGWATDSTRPAGPSLRNAVRTGGSSPTAGTSSAASRARRVSRGHARPRGRGGDRLAPAPRPALARNRHWTGDGGIGTRHEADHLVEVDGDLGHPALEWSGHPAGDRFGPDVLPRLKENRAPGEYLIHELIAKALQARPDRL